MVTLPARPNDIASLGQHGKAGNLFDSQRYPGHLRFVVPFGDCLQGSRAVRSGEIREMHELQTGVERHIALTPAPENLVNRVRLLLRSCHSVGFFFLTAGRTMRTFPTGSSG